MNQEAKRETMFSVITAAMRSMAAEWVVKSVGTMLITALITGGSCNTLHKFRDGFQSRRNQRKGYKQGYADASEACENGTMNERRRLLPWLRNEQPESEPAWMAVLDVALPVEADDETILDDEPKPDEVPE